MKKDPPPHSFRVIEGGLTRAPAEEPKGRVTISANPTWSEYSAALAQISRDHIDARLAARGQGDFQPK
jgi:hypothetical protein